MSHRLASAVAALSVVTVLSAGARAVTLAQESFNAPNDSTGFAAGSSFGPTDPTGLTYPGLQTSGGSRTYTGFGSNTRGLAAPVGGDGTVTYVGYLLSGSQFDRHGITLFANGSEILEFGNDGGNYRILTGDTTNPNFQNFTTPGYAGGPSLLVLKIDQAADSLSLYVNPTPGAEPAAPTLTVSDFSPDAGTQGFPTFAFDALRLFNGDFSGGTSRFDEVRVGTTFADAAPAVVPEPASLAAVSAAALALAARRRRRA